MSRTDFGDTERERERDFGGQQVPDLARRLRMLAQDLLDALGEPWPR